MEKRSALEWARATGDRIIDPSGWRRNDGVTLSTPITLDDYLDRMAVSTVYFPPAPARPSETPVADPTNPAHYRDLSPEPIEVILGWRLGFLLGNAVKYIARAGRKGSTIEDLRKARWYLDRAIASLEQHPSTPLREAAS